MGTVFVVIVLVLEVWGGHSSNKFMTCNQRGHRYRWYTFAAIPLGDHDEDDYELLREDMPLTKDGSARFLA